MKNILFKCLNFFNEFKTKKEYYESGELLFKGSFKKGNRDGFSKWYFKSGQLKSEVFYENGRKKGVERIYYESGELKAKIFYKDGIKNEETIYFNISGGQEYSVLFENNKPVKGYRYTEHGNVIALNEAQLYKIKTTGFL